MCYMTPEDARRRKRKHRTSIVWTVFKNEKEIIITRPFAALL